MTRGELVPRRIIAQGPGDAAGRPQPPKFFLLGQPLLTKRAYRNRQGRSRGRVILAYKQGQPVEQQIARSHGGLPVGGQDGRRDLANVAPAHQSVSREPSRKGLEVRLSREAWVERFQPLGRFE